MENGVKQQERPCDIQWWRRPCQRLPAEAVR